MPQQTESNTIRLVHPGAGQIVTVPINVDYIRLSLGFEPDPNAVQRNGQNLEFVFEDGGKIVLQGYYYYYASKTLPVIVTENGDEIAGEDFLASLREELLTAAAPEIISSSGAGEYVDNAGNLVESVARISPLGAIYLDQAAEGSEPYFGFASTGYATGSSSFITLRPTPPDEWPDIPGGPGYQISVSGAALTFDETYLQGGSVAGAEGAAINGKMVFEIAGNDALASLTVNGTNYTVGSNGVINGLVGQMFADADGGCCSITQASVIPGATLESSYLIMEFILDQPHGHTYGVQGPDQIELLGEVVVIAHSVNGATSETVSGTVSVIDDVPSVDYVVDTVYSRPESNDKSEMLKIDFGGTADEAIPGGALVLGTIPILWGADGSESLVISHQELGTLDLSGLESSAKSYDLNGGTLTLRQENDELKFEFASRNLEGQDIIEANLLTITVTDGDGDNDSIALHLNVQDKATSIQSMSFVEGGDSIVSEAQIDGSLHKGFDGGEAYMTLVEDAGGVGVIQSSSYQTLFASVSELGVGDIMEGNSFSNGGSDGEVLYGSLGDDVMFGSDGLDIFAWMPDEIDNGYDQILDFRYGSDMLRFDSLLREGGQSIEELLDNSVLLATAVDEKIVLTVTQGDAAVTVNINFEGDVPFANASEFNGLNHYDQATVLQQMIITSSGG